MNNTLGKILLAVGFVSLMALTWFYVTTAWITKDWTFIVLLVILFVLILWPVKKRTP